MKTTKNIMSFVAKIATNFLLACLLAVGVSQFIEVPILGFAATVTASFLVVSIVGATLGFKTSKYAFMALQTEVWVNDIMEILYPANDFMSRAVDHSQFVSHLTVHIPQNQVKPTVSKNNTTLPIAASSRTDVDFTYSLNNYKGEPIVIPNLEQLQISYDKRASVMRNYYSELYRAVSNNTLYAWAVAGASNLVKTSGAATGSVLAPSATGTRLALTLADIQAAKAKLDKQNVPAEGRILLFDSDMYNNQFLSITNVQAYYASQSMNLQTGIMGRIMGFDVMVRSSVLTFDNSFAPKAVNDTGDVSSPATTDNVACLAYHPSFTSKALGAVNIYFQENNPLYYGPILSAEVNHGASPLYQNSLGIVAICQTA